MIFATKALLWIATGVANLASLLATLFTDAQWADVQSFLNFVVLAYLAYGQKRVRERAPREVARQTKDDLISELAPEGPDSELRNVFIETVLDAMEERRRRLARSGGARRADTHS